MAGVDFSQPLLGAGATARTDFASAEARTGIDFDLAANFKRGLQARVGIEAFANASAGLKKFINANIEGTAFAAARAGVQLQLPLNLFDRFGFSARAEARAEAAAGIAADIGLSIGDFVLLAKRDPDMIGLPLELLLLFLEEVSIGGSFEVSVSASAMAHASLSVSGCVVEKGGEKAGFFFTADAGVGLAAGVGMGVAAGAEFRDFRRFYGRAVDKTVDTVVREVIEMIPAGITLPSGQPIAPVLGMFAPVAKIALRTAYDLGLKISENNPGASALDAAALCDEVVKTVLEEGQRFIFKKLLDAGLSNIKTGLQHRAAANPQVWTGTQQLREQVASLLLQMPTEPHQPTAEVINYWKTVVARTGDLITALGGDSTLEEGATAVYAASELLLEAVRTKVNKTTAYATAIGVGTIAADREPFKSRMSDPPPDFACRSMNRLSGGNLQHFAYADLLRYLVNYAVVTNVRGLSPELDGFLQIFSGRFGQTENRILEMLLTNAQSFDPTGSSTTVDPANLLLMMRDALDAFLTDTFKRQVLPIVLDHVNDPSLRLYLEEVLTGAVVYMKQVGLDSVVNWQRRNFSNDDFTESLAGVMMLLLGRTIVVVGDTFLNAAQLGIERECGKVARRIRDAADGVAVDIQLLNAFGSTDPEVLRLAADCVDIGGKVLGPFPSDTRQRVRHLLYQIFEPIPAGREEQFLDSLADQFFIPNQEQLQQLTDELTHISSQRFGEFAEVFLLRMGKYVLERLEDVILFAVDLVVNWERHLSEALLQLASFLRDLQETIHRVNEELIRLTRQATDALRALFHSLESPGLRNRLRRDIKAQFISKALNALERSEPYRRIPKEFRAGVRSMADDAVDAIMDHPLVDPVFDAITEVAAQLDELLPDVRKLNPHDNLPEQLLQLILDRLEDRVRVAFGGSHPHISPAIDFSFEFFGRQRVHIPLGRIEVPLAGFIDVVRNGIERVDFYHDRLNTAGLKLGHALAAELELSANRLLYEQQSREQDRLHRVDREHNNDPREILILSPSNLAHYSSAIDVQVHLGGVPMSYLGLGKDEAQRVLIYLNGHLIPPKSLLSPDGTEDMDYSRRDFDFRQLFVTTANSGAPVNAFDAKTGIIKTRKATIVTNTATMFRSHRDSDFNEAPVVFAGALTEQPATRLVIGAGKRYGRPAATVGVGSDTLGRSLLSHDINGRFTGRKLRSSDADNLVASARPGIMLQIRVRPDDSRLNEGVNTLTVVVIERGGVRHQQHVTFTLSTPPPVRRSSPGVRRRADNGSGAKNGEPLTLKTAFNDNLDDARKGRSPPTGRAYEALSSYVLSPASNFVKPSQPSSVIAAQASRLDVRRRESIVVRDGKGRVVRKLTISFGSTAERERLLKRKRLRSSDLAPRGLRLTVAGADYLHKLDFATEGSKKTSAIEIEYQQGANVADLLDRAQDLSGKRIAMTSTGSHGEGAAQRSLALLDVSSLAEETKRYLRDQYSSNFVEFRRGEANA